MISPLSDPDVLNRLSGVACILETGRTILELVKKGAIELIEI